MARATASVGGVPAGALGAVRAVAVRPRLWPAAVRQARALVPQRWWRHRPFLPWPDRDWLAFRLTTAYGDPRAALVPEDLVTWLAWSSTVRTGSHTAGATSSSTGAGQG